MDRLGRGAVILVVALGICSACGESTPKKQQEEKAAAPENAKRPALAAGQRWAYRTRPSDAGSHLVIGKIDTDPRRGKIVHISVFGVNTGQGEPVAIGHLPFSDEAVNKSVTELLGNDGLVSKSFESGYATWKESFDTGKGGVFVLPVAETLESVLAAKAAP